MWKSVSKEKYERNKRRRLRKKVGGIFAFWLLPSLVFTVLRKPYDPARSYFNSWEELSGRLPFYMAIALSAAILTTLGYLLIRYKLGGVEFLLCPQCGNIKHNDGKVECSCGGRFADLDAFDWCPESDLDQPVR